MGASTSVAICPYCATQLDLTSKNATGEHMLCGRCHGAITNSQTKQSRNSRISYLFPSRNHTNNVTTDKDAQIVLKYLHIFPFAQDLQRLQSEEKQNISSDYLIDEYLEPYFTQNCTISITSGTRMIIKDIEFKVMSCYPPNGIVTCSTSFHLNDTHNQLLTLNSHPIQQIRILPTASSLKAHNIDTINIKDLVESHLKPYLHGNDACLYFGKYSETIQKRHLIEGQMFIFNGIEWRVMESQPFDGFIDSQTAIYCEGRAINDLKQIHIRPKHDSLPDAHKHWSSQQIQQHYLYPMLYGTSRYFDTENVSNFKSDDIEYIVHGIQPKAGIITCNAMMNCKPIKSAEIIYIQQEKDAEFALKLQQEEYVNVANVQMSAEHNEWISGAHYPLFLNAPLFPSFAPFSASGGYRNRKKTKMGLNQQLLNTLPTYIYSIKTKDIGITGEDQDVVSCRICLYTCADGDTIKILPCLHKYHAVCVDEWLKHSIKCPICTTSVFD